MTVPTERTRAVEYAREFMRDLLDCKITPRVPKEVREMALRVLRHFPGSCDLHQASEASPSIFGKPESEAIDYANYDSYRAFRAQLYRVRTAKPARNRRRKR